MTNEEYRKELQRMPIFGFVMDFCKLLLLRLMEERIFVTKDYDPNGIIYQKAIFDMLLRDPRNIETFALRDYDEIRFSEHKGKTDKNGKIKKLQSVRADLVRKHTTFIKA